MADESDFREPQQQRVAVDRATEHGNTARWMYISLHFPCSRTWRAWKSHLKVDGIVAGRDLQGAGPKLRVHRLVCHNGDAPAAHMRSAVG